MSGPVVRKPLLFKKKSKIQCNTENYVPIVVPGLSTGPSSLTASTSLIIVNAGLNRGPHVKSSNGTTSEYQQFTTGEPVTRFYRNQNKNQNKDTVPVQGDLLRDLPEWLEDFKENPEDAGVSALRDTPASTSRESASEPPRKVVSGKHSFFTHFTKDRNWSMLVNQDDKGSLQKTHFAKKYLEQKSLTL